MAPRRSHKKSRAGCLKCKTRRIKCDEVHPACGNCIKHAIECDFSRPEAPVEAPRIPKVAPGTSASPTPPPPPPQANNLRISSLEPQPPPPPSRLQPSPAPSHTDDHLLIHPSSPVSLAGISTAEGPSPLSPGLAEKRPFSPSSSTQSPLSPFAASCKLTLQSFPPGSPPPPETLDILDLSLMHHWSVFTSSTIASRESVRVLWRVNIPTLAVQHPFLMHSLLAVSALHLHSKELDHARAAQYFTCAAHHHAHAVRGMSALLGHISRDNCDALVVSSSLLVIYSFVCSRFEEAVETQGSGLPTIGSWLPLLRGVYSILLQAWSWVTNGPLSPLILQYRLSSSEESLDSESERMLTNLYRLCTDRSLPGAEELKDTAVSTAYFSAIVELRKSFATVPHWEHTIGSVFVWPITAADKFVELLVDRRPRALVIFVHYCALFALVEEFWWTKGSALYELRRCEMCLSEEWKTPWLEWPRKKILKRDVERIVTGRGAPRPGTEETKEGFLSA